MSFKPAGRDTLAVIEAELAAPAASGAQPPHLEISESVAGRDTLAAIAEELSGPARPKQSTLRYGDRIANAPGAHLPSRPPLAPRHRAPTSAPAASPVAAAAPALQIFELVTFIVRGSEAHDLGTEAERRSFVEQHLLHRVPRADMSAVERIEVTPWTAKGTMVLRVWCRA